MEASPKENRSLASMWLILALAVAAIGIYFLFTPGKYLMPSFLGFSLILFYVGRQRLNKYKLEPGKFQKIVRNISLFVVFASAIASAVTAHV